MPTRLAAGSHTNHPLPAHPPDCQLVPKACCSLWQLTAHTLSALPPSPAPAAIPIHCRSNVGLLSYRRGSCCPEHPPLWPPWDSVGAAGWADPPSQPPQSAAGMDTFPVPVPNMVRKGGLWVHGVNWCCWCTAKGAVSAQLRMQLPKSLISFNFSHVLSPSFSQ